MEKDTRSLEDRITEVLGEAEEPLRAIDIVEALAGKDFKTTTTEVNKALYNGAFEQVSKRGKPTWKVCKVPVIHLRPEGMYTFSIDGLAVVSIPIELPEYDCIQLLGAFHAMNGLAGQQPERLFHAEPTPAGEALANLARQAGFAIGAPMVPASPQKATGTTLGAPARKEKE